MPLKLVSPTAVASMLVALVQAPAVLAESWSGICFFNQDTMPCQIGSDPYELHVHRVDGSSARFRFNASTDSFAGPENGIWTVSHDPIRGLYLQHQDGDAVGFMQR